MRLWLAIKCFFLILFGKSLPGDPRLEKLLPARPVPALPPPPPPPPADDGPALQLLVMLQREGRFIDFLSEPIEGYDDAQIGAAVRSIHKGCKKVIDQVLVLGPALAGKEDASVSVDAASVASGTVKLTGNVSGAAPFKGVLRHPGWVTSKVTLPRPPAGQDPHVIAAAEVELS